eukprot:4335214-Karenia_brevis.AAC.1
MITRWVIVHTSPAAILVVTHSSFIWTHFQVLKRASWAVISFVRDKRQALYNYLNTWLFWLKTSSQQSSCIASAPSLLNLLPVKQWKAQAALP